MQLFIDLDGTIVDPSPRYYKLYSDLAKTFGFPIMELDQYWQMKREFVPEIEIFKKGNVNESEIAEYLSQRARLIEESSYLALDRISVLTVDWLEHMSQEHSLYLVTLRKNNHALLEQLTRLGVTQYFKEVLSQDNNKGDYLVKVKLIEKHLKSPGEAWLIGDTEVDIQAGKKLGIKTAAISSGLRTDSFLRRYSPTLIMHSLADFRLD